MSIPHHSTHSDRVLSLLESGVGTSDIAKSLGITPSAVTQLMDSDLLKDKVAAIREAQLTRSASLDTQYDRVEQALLNQFEMMVPMLVKPDQTINALRNINAMRRRGIALTQDNKPPTQVVHLVLPPQIVQKVTTNISNQVVSVGGQQLITMQSSNIPKLAEASNALSNHPPQLVQIEQEDEYGFTTPRSTESTQATERIGR